MLPHCVEPNRYLLCKCTHIREVNVVGTAVREEHLQQLLQASMSLVLLRFTWNEPACRPPNFTTLTSLIAAYPHVLLMSDKGFVFLGYSTLIENTLPCAHRFEMLNAQGN